MEFEARILLVDDEPGNIEMLAASLDERYALSFATSGEEALRLAANLSQPDLILLDVVMPDLDGFEVCRRLKRNPITAAIPIIFVTALDDGVSEERGLAVGAVDYIHKPIVPAVVRARVNVHLEVRRHREFLANLLERRTEDLRASEDEARALLASMRDSEARLRAFMDHAPQALSLKDLDGRYLMVNRAAARRAGFSVAEMIGRTNTELERWTPGLRASVVDHEREVVRTRRAVERERREVERDGTPYTLTITKFPVLDGDGEPVAIGTVNTDLSPIIESQRQANELRSAINEASDAVALWDEGGRLVFTNHEYHRCFPHSPDQGEIIGMAIEEVLRGDVEVGLFADPAALADPDGYIRSLIEQTDQASFAVREVAYSGNRTFLRRQKRFEDGSTLVLYTDITERKQAERELDRQQRELRRLASEVSLAEQRERRRISAELHDGAVQRLGLVRMKVGALRQRLAGAPSSGLVEEVKEHLDLAIREVRSLMSELSPPMLYELGLRQAIEWLVDRFRARHALDCRFEAHGELAALGGEVDVLLFQAVRELLVNVVKHAQATSASVELRVRGDRLSVAVEDDGIGLPAAGPGERPSDTGGFGLFSLRERVGLLGGRLLIERGQGTRVVIEVPVPPAPGTRAPG